MVKAYSSCVGEGPFVCEWFGADAEKLRDAEMCIRDRIDTVRQGGVDITPENLLVSERASLLLPWHRELDALEEQRLKDKKYGSTKQGIAPFYSDKYQKKTVLAGELLYPDHLRDVYKRQPIWTLPGCWTGITG